MNALITLRVPATSANLGSGFDTIGMAVSLYNIFKVTELLPEGEYKVEALGEGARELSSPKANLVVKAYEETCERWNVKGPGFALWCHNIIPLCRGLGSSAGAVVAGVLIAKYLTGYDADDDELLRAMTMIEGHPDNVAPCFLGGMVVSCWDGKELRYVNLPPLPPEGAGADLVTAATVTGVPPMGMVTSPSVVNVTVLVSASYSAGKSSRVGADAAPDSAGMTLAVSAFAAGASPYCGTKTRSSAPSGTVIPGLSSAVTVYGSPNVTSAPMPLTSMAVRTEMVLYCVSSATPQ